MNAKLFIKPGEKLFQYENEVYKINKPLNEIINDQFKFKLFNSKYSKIKKASKLTEYAGNSLEKINCNLCNYFSKEEKDCLLENDLESVEEIVVQKYKENEYFMMNSICVVDVNLFLIAKNMGFMNDYFLEGVEPGQFQTKEKLQFSFYLVEQACEDYYQLFEAYKLDFVKENNQLFSN